MFPHSEGGFPLFCLIIHFACPATRPYSPIYQQANLLLQALDGRENIGVQ
jgi:ABC-type thiamine transport system ATPase subunit